MTKRQRARRDLVDIALTSLLDTLAPILIPLDITPARLAQIARASFAKSGAKHSPAKRSGRPHIARIAAVTGLTRAEVKRLVATNFSIEIAGPESMPRALRVLHGWQNSPQYKKSGRPMSLPILGVAPSFASLCKTYSGDIPHTVILEELLRRGSVKLERGRRKVSVSSIQVPANKNFRHQSTLAFAASLVRDALSQDAVLMRRAEKVYTSSDLPDAYVERAIAGRLSELLDALPQQFVRKGQAAKNILEVFALVVRKHKAR